MCAENNIEMGFDVENRGESIESWFSTWFDSKYYHLLYHERDESEANTLIKNIVHFLQPMKDATFLDTACGNGRHARILALLGYDVTGADLSGENIEIARLDPSPNLHYLVHDMRLPYDNNMTFDYILNLFTSFGYFESYEEHLHTLTNFANCLNFGGYFVLDYMNVHYVKNNLVTNETKTISDVEFCINRKVDDEHIIKEIQILDRQQNFIFYEKVKNYSYLDLSKLVEKSGFMVECLFGDYSLSPFKVENSPRCILVCRKIFE